MSFDHEKFAAALADWVEKNNSSQSGFAREAGIQVGDISNYKTGRKVPSVPVMDKIEKFLGVKEGHFFTDFLTDGKSPSKAKSKSKSRKVTAPVNPHTVRPPYGTVDTAQSLKEVAEKAIETFSSDTAELLDENVIRPAQYGAEHACPFTCVDMLASGELLLKNDEGEFYKATKL